MALSLIAFAERFPLSPSEGVVSRVTHLWTRPHAGLSTPLVQYRTLISLQERVPSLSQSSTLSAQEKNSPSACLRRACCMGVNNSIGLSSECLSELENSD